MLNLLEPGTIVELPAGEVTSAVTIPSGITLRGANYGKKATSAERENETVFSSLVTFNGKASVDGVTITARPTFVDTEEVTFLNTIMTDIDLSGITDHLAAAIIGINNWENSVKLNFEGCYFGDNTNCYNAFELNVKVADGTVIKNNMFSTDVCNHNVMNIYAVDDGATIIIEDNEFAKSANAIRIGTKGDSQNVHFIIDGNMYETTDTQHPDYAGLLLIQPYGRATTGMGGLRIDIDNTINNSGVEQLWYYYAGGDDAQLEVEDKPKIYVNGVEQSYV